MKSPAKVSGGDHKGKPTPMADKPCRYNPCPTRAVRLGRPANGNIPGRLRRTKRPGVGYVGQKTIARATASFAHPPKSQVSLLAQGEEDMGKDVGEQ